MACSTSCMPMVNVEYVEHMQHMQHMQHIHVST
jgi:hypothetical protein